MKGRVALVAIFGVALLVKAEMRKFRDSTLALRNKVHAMIVQKKCTADRVD